MGDNKRNNKSVLKLFKGKARKPLKEEDSSSHGRRSQKVLPSDEDESPWTADPRINDKTSAFIARHYFPLAMVILGDDKTLCPIGNKNDKTSIMRRTTNMKCNDPEYLKLMKCRE
ncbi:hypothetical protein GH714_020252 [Hevea brasiliensis]|uniref:Uncharacterized protein n=1 Tax=Hevea brasiliensis TaxID=3981 RepID=A0A6A6LI41_HEVBR|nr:hypothetical protein GH714_020252 [Hevea brasiliensis]